LGFTVQTKVQVCKTFVRPGAYPRVEHLNSVSLGMPLAIITNIRLCWKGLSGANSPDYYENHSRLKERDRNWQKSNLAHAC